MQLANRTWTQVESYLSHSKKILIPIGSTEQHGPTGLIGTDFLTSNEIAIAVGERTKTLVAPPLCYGMALHHMGFAGTVSLTPQTLISVIIDVVGSLKTHGFESFLFVNGHGGNMATISTAFSAIKNGKEESTFKLYNWWRLPEVQAYEEKEFGDQNGFHATVGEVSVTMLTNESAFEDIPQTKFEIDRPKYDMPLSPYEFRKTFPDGRMESNPGLASKEHGKVIFDIAVNAIAKEIENIR